MNTSTIKSDERIIFELRSIYNRFGYSRYRMSKFEEYEFYLHITDFLISDSVITFTDTNGRLMALKPDVTLSIVKTAAISPAMCSAYTTMKTCTAYPRAQIVSGN